MGVSKATAVCSGVCFTDVNPLNKETSSGRSYIASHVRFCSNDRTGCEQDVTLRIKEEMQNRVLKHCYILPQPVGCSVFPSHASKFQILRGARILGVS